MSILSNWCRHAIAVGLLALGVPLAVYADELFSNLHGSGGFGSFLVSGNQAFATFPHDVDIASRFQVNQLEGGTFDWAEMLLSIFSGPNLTRVHLYSDDNDRPGQVIETIVLTDIAMFHLGVTPFTTVASAIHPMLQAGGMYWLGVDVSSDTVLSWGSVSNEGAAYATSYDQGPWDINTLGLAGAFCINCTLIPPPPIPEPSSFILILGGLIIVFTRMRSKRQVPILARVVPS